jgi:hypothetical protein
MKRYFIKLRFLPNILTLIVVSLFFLGWGELGHKIISKAGARNFPDLSIVTPSIIQRLTDSASVPDWRNYGSNGYPIDIYEPNHFMDMERLAEFSTHSITHNRDSLFQEYGEAYIRNTVGFLPWVIDSVMTVLTNQMRSQDWNRAWSTAGDLGHYIGDAHQPLHATEHYNGYTKYGSGSSGVHSRYESTMINRFQSSILIDSSAVYFIPNPLDTAFASMYQSNSYIDSIYIADQIARSYDAAFGTTYYDTLWGRVNTFTLLQFHRAAIEYGSYLYTAWVNAGRPSTVLTPLLSVPSSISFVNTIKGDSSSVILPIKSASSSALTINSVTNSLSIFQQNISTPVTMNGNDTLKARITFKPTTYGSFIDTLTITSDGGIGKVVLTGSSPFPALVSIPQTINFGKIKYDSTLLKTIALTDSSMNAISIDSLYTKTKYFNYFSPMNTPIIFPYRINKGDTLKLILSFKPDTIKPFVDTLYAENNSNQSLVKIPLQGNGSLTFVEKGFSDIPMQYDLSQNYPNPFNPGTTISFSVRGYGYTSLKVFNIVGREVATLVDEVKHPGIYSISWYADKYPSGIYFYRLTINGNSIVRKMIFLK